jgi:hypothetical protein
MANKKNLKETTPIVGRPEAVAIKDLKIPRPGLLLATCTLAVYFSCFYLGYTELDDTIFINDFKAYNENLGNLLTSFQRGVFDPVNDIYYRPLFLNSMVLNYLVSGAKIAGYHVVNVLFHIANVLLLFRLLEKLAVKEWQSFILALLFAVHPVLTQAVAWIPGRNDTLLAIFTFSYLIFTVNYSENGKTKDLAWGFIFLLCAYFTKETAVFGPPVAFIILVLFLKKKWLDKRNLVQYGMWITAFLVWYLVRSTAHLKASFLDPSVIASEFPMKLPVIIQYLGKIFLPFNLSVFPIQEDTVYYFGLAALVIVIAIVILAKEKNYHRLAGGTFIFLLFLLPLLILPRALNEQTFEHRLYLPMIGILLMLPETILFKNGLKDKQVFQALLVLAGVLAVVNYNHQQSFNDPYTFWKKAEETSPHSAYAVMMLGARTQDKPVAYSYIRRAYQLNPEEKYLNYYYGMMLLEQDSAQQAEQHFLTEKKVSNYFECDFHLADIAFKKKDYKGSIAYLQQYLKRNPTNPMANNNLLLLYIETKQKDNAAAQAKRMTELGMATPKLPD